LASVRSRGLLSNIRSGFLNNIGSAAASSQKNNGSDASPIHRDGSKRKINFQFTATQLKAMEARKM
jgi:hypothetical protein